MKALDPARLAWALFAVLVGLLAVATILTAANGDRADVAPTILLSLDFVAVGFVGSLVASRRPENRIGWLLIGIMLAMGITFVSDAYAVYALFTRPTIAGGRWAAWLSGWVWVIAVSVFLTFLPLLFPDGKLPSPRWRPFALATGTFIATAIVVLALQPKVALDARVGSVPNPIGVEGLAGAAEWFDGAGGAIFVCFAIVSGFSLVRRFRRRSGIQRQQIKWFALSIALLVAYFVITTVLEATGATSPGDTPLGVAGATLSILAVPISIAVAILRYRLYDIDVIINRALVYGALTAVLGVAYAVIVTVAGTVVEGSEIVTAGATLAVAALFQPLRRHIQGFIDRRFYRRKYDAARTVEGFSSRLRNEIDLEAMRADLLAAVQETMQPRQTSLWLRS